MASDRFLRFKRAALAPLLVVVLAACNGLTLPASQVTDSSATLNGQGSCGTNTNGSPGTANCSYYYQYGVGTYDNGNNFSIAYQPTPTRGTYGNTCGNACTVPLAGENITGLQPGTTYRYQVCGKGDDVSAFVCVGPNGQAGSSQTFTTSGPPRPQAFTRSAVTVTPGSSLSLHWQRQENEYFILTSSGANAFPGLQTAATWPTPGATWQGSPYNWWTTNARAVSLAIPATAQPGTEYVLDMFTCNAAVNLCSNAAGSTATHSTVTITVAGSNWTARPYTQDFSSVTMAPQSSGHVLDVAFDGSTIWNVSEFSDAVGETGFGDTSVTLHPNPDFAIETPFGFCWANCGSSGLSALGERVVYTEPQAGFEAGLVWTSHGGGYGTLSVPNHSVISAYDPSDGGFCSYLVPGDGNSVFGLEVVGTGEDTTVWFAEALGAAISSFSPSDVGMDCTPQGQWYELDGEPSFDRIEWDDISPFLSSNPFPGFGNLSWPAMITADPNGEDLWVSAFLGDTLARVHAPTGSITYYPIAGPSPWQVAVDDDFVYTIDYGAQQLVRVNKSTMGTDTVQLPVTADQQEGYGLALAGDRLYFSLSNDAQIVTMPLPFAPMGDVTTTFGYIDLSTWGATSPQPSTAVVYTGLMPQSSTTRGGNFRGIAVSDAGEVALADTSFRVGTGGSLVRASQVIRLTP